MLDNRDYMRGSDRFEGFSWRRLPAYVWLMIVIAAVFFIDKSDTAHFHSRDWKYLALSVDDIKHGFIWQFLTFQFLHQGMEHLVGNLLGIWCFSRTVEIVLGKARFLRIYFLSGVVGGILQWCLMALLPNQYGTSVIGASAGVCGLLAAFALIDPEAIILIQFIMPIRAKYLLYMGIAIALFLTLFPTGNTANAAHLGGMLFGVAYMKFDWQRWNGAWPVGWFRRKKVNHPRGGGPIPEKILAKLRHGSMTQNETPAAKEFISSEVDPILDKISAHGIQSLTDRERQILQSARAKISKR